MDVICPNCMRLLQIPDTYAGQSGRCNACGGAIQVPAEAPAPASRIRDDILRELRGEAAREGAASSTHRVLSSGLRPDVGMIATEAKPGARARESLGRIIVLTLVMGFVALFVVPVVVIGITAEETAPSVPIREPVVPTARGSVVPHAVDRPGVAEVPGEAPTQATTEDEDPGAALARPVFVTRSGARYHKATCHHVRDERARMTLGEAQARGWTACKVCGG